MQFSPHLSLIGRFFQPPPELKQKKPWPPNNRPENRERVECYPESALGKRHLSKIELGRLRIRDLEQHSGVSRRTIHYYLREGLLQPPWKSTAILTGTPALNSAPELTHAVKLEQALTLSSTTGDNTA